MANSRENQIDKVVKHFKENQTFANLQAVVNLGMAMKRFENNKWVDSWGRFEMPIDEHRIVTVYEKDDNGVIVPVAIGTY